MSETLTVTRISMHAIARAKERLLWNQGTLRRMTQKAVEKGVRAESASKELRLYLEARESKYGKGGDSVIYAGVVYIIESAMLVTVFPLPKDFRA